MGGIFPLLHLVVGLVVLESGFRERDVGVLAKVQVHPFPVAGVDVHEGLGPGWHHLQGKPSPFPDELFLPLGLYVLDEFVRKGL